MPGRRPEVGVVEDGGQHVTPDTGSGIGHENECGVDAEQGDGDEQRGQEPEGPPCIEMTDVDPACSPVLAHEHRGDEEAAQNEEGRNGRPRTRQGLEVGVVDEDGDDDEGAHTGQWRPVAQMEDGLMVAGIWVGGLRFTRIGVSRIRSVRVLCLR